MTTTVDSSLAHPPSVVVMGVEGSGKTTVARALADSLGAAFLDADSLHSRQNRQKMAAGRALSDEDRLPWLRSVGEELRRESARGHSVVVACSALKRRYRDFLRTYDADVVFLHLSGPIDVVRARIGARTHEFAGLALLDSQYEQLEPLENDERGMTVDLRLTPEEIVSKVRTHLA